MKITEATNRTPDLIARLLEVWESSVRATHLFLSDGEIERIKAYVPQALRGVAHLVAAENGAGRPAAPKKAGDCPAFGKPSRASGAPAGRFFAPALERCPQAPGLFLRDGGASSAFLKTPGALPPRRGPGVGAGGPRPL